MQFVRFVFTFSFAIATLLIAGLDASAQKQPDKMTVSYSASGGQYINLFVAKELGIFEKHNLDVTLNQINSSSQAVASLRSKSVDVATGPAGVIFDAIAKGVTDFTVFGECMPSTASLLDARPPPPSPPPTSNEIRACSAFRKPAKIRMLPR